MENRWSGISPLTPQPPTWQVALLRDVCVWLGDHHSCHFIFCLSTRMGDSGSSIWGKKKNPKHVLFDILAQSTWPMLNVKSIKSQLFSILKSAGVSVKTVQVSGSIRGNQACCSCRLLYFNAGHCFLGVRVLLCFLPFIYPSIHGECEAPDRLL